MEEVKILVKGEVFTANKEHLCEYSDYFRAMFCGSYVENEKKEIEIIEYVDAASMQNIIQYMTNGTINLSDFDLSTVIKLAQCSGFLQVTKLLQQIEQVLQTRISYETWLIIARTAHLLSFNILEKFAVTLGLLWFKHMHSSDVIFTIDELFWYVSHPCLNVENEFELFNFVHSCLSHTVPQSDRTLIALACLDLEKVTYDDLREIRKLIRDYSTSEATQVVECLFELSEGNYELAPEVLDQHKLILIEMFTENVYEEVVALVKANKPRMLRLTPTLPMWVIKETEDEIVPYHLYCTFTRERGFEKWIKVAEKNSWGWNVVAWGSTKIVVVGGEKGRGTGLFLRDIKVYDTLKKEWINHGVELPSRRHSGLTIVGDSLFIIGGVDAFRTVLDTVLLYDLINLSFRKIAKLPDAIQMPAVCNHEGDVYTGGHKNIYKYEDRGETDTWTRVLETDLRNNILMSFKGYIYCTQQFSCDLYRFKPNVEYVLEKITNFTNPPAAVCNLGDRLFVFTMAVPFESDITAVEEYKGKIPDEKPKVLWFQTNTTLKVKECSGCCALLMDFLPRKTKISDYAYTYMKKYASSLDDHVKNKK